MNFPLNSCGVNLPDLQLKSMWNDNKRSFSIPENISCIPDIPCSTRIQMFGKGTQDDEMFLAHMRSHNIYKSGETHSIEDILNFDEWQVIQMRPKVVVEVVAKIISEERGKIKNIDRTLIE